MQSNKESNMENEMINLLPKFNSLFKKKSFYYKLIICYKKIKNSNNHVGLTFSQVNGTLSQL